MIHDPPPPDSCPLFGYGFCSVCGRTVAADFLRLFAGWCADCIESRVGEHVAVRQLDVSPPLTIELRRDVEAMREELNAVWRNPPLSDNAKKARQRNAERLLKTLHPDDWEACKLIDRLTGGAQVEAWDLRSPALGVAIKRIRELIAYAADHADPPQVTSAGP